MAPVPGSGRLTEKVWLLRLHIGVGLVSFSRSGLTLSPAWLRTHYAGQTDLQLMTILLSQLLIAETAGTNQSYPFCYPFGHISASQDDTWLQ